MRITGADPALAALRQTLTQTSRRTEAVASNLANIDTPGYRALDVEFHAPISLGGSMRGTDAGHLAPSESASRGVVVHAPVIHERQDGNTVDIDREMTLMSMLRGRYGASAAMVRKRFALWMYAVTDGRS